MLFTSQRRRREQRSLAESLAERRLLSNGTLVTPQTSLQRVAVFASANLIASTNSQLPVDLLAGTGSRKVELDKPPLLVDPGGEGYGFEDWLWNVLFRALVQGNAVGLVAERDRFGFPTVIQLQDLDRVSVNVDAFGQVKWKINGKDIDRDRIWHFRAFPQEGKILGLSPIGLHMRTVGIGIQAEEFGSQWFSDGGHPTGIFTSEAKLNETQAKGVKDKILAVMRGSREPILLPNDIKYQPIQINPLESQFLETQKYSSAECARIFGPGVPEMLGYETGGNLTYANVEQRSLHLLIYTLNNWARRVEAALSSPRMTPTGTYVKFNRGALLQSTTLDRYKVHELALKNGWQTVDEIRELEDLPPMLDTPGDAANKAKRLAEMVQKIYLGVGIVLTADEAREIVNSAGGNLKGSLPVSSGGK